jgi:TolA-binding protein
LVIPGALAALVAGGAIGAAASYLASQPTSAGRALRSAGTAPTPARRAPTSTAAHRRPARASAAATTTGPPAGAGGVAVGQQLNDQDYAMIQHGDYKAAIPLLRRAVVDLRGAGPADPYEAYANYNLGYALLESGDCTDALPPLGRARRLETSPLVGVATRRARACTPPGS